MSVVWILLLAVLLPLGTGLASLLLPSRSVKPRVLLAMLGPLLAFVLIASNLSLPAADAAGAAAAGHATYATPPAVSAAPPPSVPWIPSLNLNLSWWPNGLGGFFGLLVSGIGVLIVLYARGYFGAADEQARLDLRRFYATLGFFTTAMLGVVLADSTLLTLVFWELTSVSSFLLIGWDRHDRNAIKLAVQAFFTTGLGGMFLLGGIAVFGATTGVWRWSELAGADVDFGSTGVVLGFVFMFVGAAAKSAQWPLHYWLPGAMAAPTPVSAFLHSATMVKAGVFLVGRLFPAFGDATDGVSISSWAGVIIPFGTVTMLLGGVMAVCKHDLKQVFAYTTISQLGLLMTMYGLGGLTYAYAGDGYEKVLPAIDFDVTQIANHAFYKAPLFICAGAIGHVASRQLPDLFGAFHKHKAICGVLLAAGWCLAALPLSISFQAKEIFLYAVVHAAKEHPLVYVVLVATLLTAMCNVAIFVRLATTLLGSERFGMKPTHGRHGHEDHGHHHAAEGGLWGAMIWLPAVPLVALQFVGGTATPLWNALFLPFETNIHYPGFHGEVPWIPHLSVELLLSAVAIAAGVALGLSPLLRGANPDAHTRIFPLASGSLEGLGGLAQRHLQTGSIRHYVSVVLTVLVAGFALAYARDRSMSEAVLAALADAGESWPVVFLGGMICLTAFLLPVARERVVRVLLLGACGFAVVAMYVLFEAPDLALTQLFFEIISVLLFVLALRLLPADAKPCGKPGPWRPVLSAAVGLTLGWLTLLAATADPPTRLGEAFVRATYKGVEDPVTGELGRGGGGWNIVNVILVDFRGFDTLGEISVLGLAALCVWAMLAKKKTGKSDAPAGGDA
ncbi:hydrogen gas-evolving membrane-bound hydrogenase subunit E [Phycisphaera mikurensis]|uniref:Na(+)/H(+) antiporter subunit A n=1 Tax=Phycisphaera mikurensis (strain NBRC 102666 / KCTC 22515 / FYK2301M01) TaxID=1142394 RepID=I0IC46_PHYMF|nr:hydrogen gas-evolving membrane-bound hydrogenase subunit E [Phycisphaera mikurensis]MBB6441945.1 NADH:ubiquinone oxidoreductase subunit 5 (subunit L)/multisubunit Na+/H+ antiporter MnhA subunit [Phycisphaera mikurensis]BAM02834.1 Na(+)/H(+) antiporter subunit A [Phycisphaera mikurensis NBRC 102666]